MGLLNNSAKKTEKSFFQNKYKNTNTKQLKANKIQTLSSKSLFKFIKKKEIFFSPSLKAGKFLENSLKLILNRL
ncbi:hypothetical protein [Flavobacterium magnesitis]|uniref:hypothetical protein n=1 Tax=Flavobacterium magnesitis TaxID=3138077 RepID=UPI00358E9C83